MRSFFCDFSYSRSCAHRTIKTDSTTCHYRHKREEREEKSGFELLIGNWKPPLFVFSEIFVDSMNNLCVALHGDYSLFGAIDILVQAVWS